MFFVTAVGFIAFLLVLAIVFGRYNRSELFVNNDLNTQEINEQYRCLDRCKSSYVFWLNSDQYLDYRDCINKCFPNPGIKMNILENEIKK